MPQVWLTYEEYADFTGQPVEDVRALVRAEAWDLRKSRDGRTRLKLPLAHMAPYICRLAEHLNRTAAAGAAAGSQAERVEWLAQRLRSAGIEVRATAGEAADDRAGSAPATPASLGHAA
jgi:hypothetical protein